MAVLSNWMAEARRLESSGDVQGAVGIYRKALVRQEETVGFADLSLHNGLGDLFLRAGQVPQALEAYERAAEQCEEHQLYANAIALCKKILRNAPEHLPAYRRVARLSALSGLEAEARLHYARYRDGLTSVGRESEALECLREIVDAAAEEEATLTLVESLVGLSQADHALELLRNVKEKREADGRAVVLVVRRIQELQQKLAAAEADAREGSTGDSTAGPGPDEAPASSIRAVEADPSVPISEPVAAPPSEGLDDEVRSVDEHRFRSAADTGSSPDEVPSLLAELQIVLAEMDGVQRFERALGLIDRIIELRPGNVELLSRKVHYASVVGDESAVVDAYLELGESLDRSLEGFTLRALSTVAGDGRVTAAVRIENVPSHVPGP